MGGSKLLSPQKCYEDAKIMLENKDLVGFVSKITSAILLVNNDKKMLAKALYLQVEGLYKLKQHKKALEYIPEAIKYNTGEQIFRLKNYAGVIHGYLGEVGKAERSLLKILENISNKEFLTEVYLNLVWVYLTVEKKHKKLKDAKKYLDMAYDNFDLLPNSLKRKVCNNFSVYYYYKSDFEKSIQLIDEAFNYAEEKDLPKLYNNKAEILIKYDEEASDVFTEIKDYLDKSEVISTKFNDKIEMGFSLYIRAMLELREDQLFKALDTLYLAFDHYNEAEAYTYSLECLLKINELVSNYKADCMKTIQEKLQQKVDGNPCYKDIINK